MEESKFSSHTLCQKLQNLIGTLNYGRALNLTKNFLSDTELQELGGMMGELTKRKVMISVEIPYPDDIRFEICSACNLPEEANKMWTPFCQHQICRYCIYTTLKEDFQDNTNKALQAQVFCRYCRSYNLHQQMEKYDIAIADWKQRNNGAEPQGVQSFRLSRDESIDQLRDPEPKIPGNKSKIRQNILKTLFPEKINISEEVKKEEQNEEILKLEKAQKETRECDLCHLRKKKNKFMILTPCGHQFCLECLETKLAELIESGEVDRDSLVCFDCQSYINYPVITYILEAKPKLIQQLKQKTHYNEYDRQEECPHCGKLMFWDKNHKDQQCIGCRYQFCSECLLPTHDSSETCKEVVEKHKKTIEKEKQFEDTPAYSRCPECFTYARKYTRQDIARCAFCKKKFCCHCKQFIEKTHKCEAMPQLVEQMSN